MSFIYYLFEQFAVILNVREIHDNKSRFQFSYLFVEKGFVILGMVGFCNVAGTGCNF